VTASAAALERAGHDVVLAVGERDPAVPLHSEVRVIAGLGAKETSGTARDAFRREISRVRPDVVHIQQLADPAVVPVARAEAPVVFNVHNFVVCTSGAKYFRRPGQACHRAHGGGCMVNLVTRGCAHTRDPRPLARMYRRTSRMIAALRSADAVVGHSRYLLDQLRLNTIKRTSFVPLFLFPQPKPSPVPNSRRILFSGRVTANKGVDTLIRAAAGLDAELELCGDGWWIPQGRKLATRLGMADRVAFRGWMSPTELSDAYRDATVVAVPSHWPEPFGLVGLEAMAHGRPVVGSDAGGIPEWLSDGESGLLVPAGDADALGRALAELLDDGDRCARMGAAGAARVDSDFSERHYMKALRETYEAACNHWEITRKAR
jgi:glycosyltransferase involved in cell wall biosynthesis